MSRPVEIAISSAMPDEVESVVACITAAFLTDPLARFAWPTPHQHLRSMPMAARAFGGASFAHGGADVAEGFPGAALWLAPGVDPDGAALERVFRETAKPEHLDDLLGTFEKMEEWHFSEPHWYLPIIGVEPPAHLSGWPGAPARASIARPRSPRPRPSARAGS